MCGSTVDSQPVTAENRQGKKKKEEEEEETTALKINIMSACAMQGGHKNVPFSAIDAQYDVTFLAVCRALCANMNNSFLVN